MKNMKNLDKTKFGSSTKAIHCGTEGRNSTHHPVNTPIYASSTFAFPTTEDGEKIFSGEDPNGYAYGRLKNPTVSDVERRLSILEGSDDCLLLASGMAAVSTFVFTFIHSGDHIIADKTLYGGTHSLFTHKLPALNIDVTFVDMSDPENVEQAIQPNTKLIYFETITNPTLRLVPIKPIVSIAHQFGVMTAVDSTFMSPILQKPLEFGIDVVIHSATKYLNGHSDIIAGAILGSQQIIDECRMNAVHYGGILGPFEAYLLGRGLKTLKIRIDAHEKNAKIIADYLVTHPGIKSVIYLGHPNHPQHELAKEQQKGFGSMITFELNGDFEGAKQFVNHLQIITRAVSLGGVESLISHPASTTHSILSEEDRLAAGITPILMRLSVGIEDVEDLIADLKQAFRSVESFIPINHVN